MDYEKKYKEALERARALRNEAIEKEYAVDYIKDYETIFPELRESEDERIVKDLIGGLMWQRDNLGRLGPHDDNLILPGFCENVGKHLSWLEKQKEQPQEELVYRLNGLMQEYIKEGKDEAEKEHRFKCYQLFWDALEDADFFEQKEQKPAEKFRVGDMIISTKNPHLTYKILEVGHINELGNPEYKVEIFTDGEPGIMDKPHNTHYMECHKVDEWGKLIEQKPVEGDNETEIQKAFREGKSAGRKEVFDHPEEYGLQKPAEWSEEDEETLNCIINVLDRLGFEEYCKSSRDQDIEEERFYYKENQVLKKLKSLRPQPKQEVPADTEVLTAKLVNLLKSYRIGEVTATGLANRIADTYGTQRYLDGLCDGEKGKWKPSEEQMDRLFSIVAALRKDYCDDMADFLASLYKQLKKL